MRNLLIISIILALFTGCSEGEESDENSEEQLCSAATGDWQVSTITCDGTDAASVGTVLLNFDTENTVVQTQGDEDCQSSMNFDSVFDFNASVNLTGNGNLSCTQNGSSVSSCTGTSNNCDSTSSITGVENDFDQCVVIANTSIRLTRTTTAQQVSDSLSGCSEGQSEVVTLTRPSTGGSAASLSISDGPTYDYGSVSNGLNSDYTFTVTNSGGEAAASMTGSGLAAPFSFLGGSYPGTGGTCGASLAASASCTVVVRFSPTASGVHSDTINMDYNDGSSAQTATRDIQGTGTSASLANLIISETDPYSYGTVPVGSSQTHTFTVTNSGSATATSISGSGLISPFSFAGGSYPGTGGTCTTSLAAAASCDIVVEAAPVAVGVHNDTINIDYNDGSSAQTTTRDVQVTAVTPGLLVISDAPLFDFGNVMVGNSSNQIFTVTNTGGFVATSIAEVGLAAPFIFTGGAYPGIGGTCGAVLVPAGNCTIDVTFAPLSLGVHADTIDLMYNDGVAVQSATRDLQGTGIP